MSFNNDLAYITHLLENALPDKNLNDYNLEFVGSSEKGEGYSGDIVFVNLKGKPPITSTNLNLAVKCSGRREIHHGQSSGKKIFENEIYLYNVVFPTFRKFQLNRGVTEYFDKYPKCHGTFIGDNEEVLVLENLKSIGYDIYDKTIPMTRKHIEEVLKGYGKWHATSAAMQDQEPEEFKKLIEPLPDLWKNLCIKTGLNKVFVNAHKDSLPILENELPKNVFDEWKNFGKEIDYNITNLRSYDKSLRVIIHGDSWNNNFMFKTTESGNLDSIFIDWQISQFSSPIIDISYFLYTCVSKKDLQDFDNLLKVYHNSFSEHLKKLGCDPDKIYPFKKFWNDWKVLSRFGIIMCPVNAKVVNVDKDNVPELKESAEKEGGISEAFNIPIKNQEKYKQKLIHIIEHAVEKGLLKPLKDL